MPEVIDYLTLYGQGMIGGVKLWGCDVAVGWYACEFPERPADPLVMWHYPLEPDRPPCRGCIIAAGALLHRHPDDPHVQWLNRRIASLA